MIRHQHMSESPLLPTVWKTSLHVHLPGAPGHHHRHSQGGGPSALNVVRGALTVELAALACVSVCRIACARHLAHSIFAI